MAARKCPVKKKSGEALSYSELYAYCIGEVGIKPDEYWRLTEAETIAKIAGYVIKRSNDSANFRNLYGAMISLWSKEKKSVEKLWEIPTDYTESDLSMGDIYERNKKILSK